GSLERLSRVCPAQANELTASGAGRGRIVQSKGSWNRDPGRTDWRPFAAWRRGIPARPDLSRSPPQTARRQERSAKCWRGTQAKPDPLGMMSAVGRKGSNLFWLWGGRAHSAKTAMVVNGAMQKVVLRIETCRPRS